MNDIARSGLRYVKDRARRRDTVGETTYRALELVSDGLDAAGKALRQLSEATQPPARARKQLDGEGAGEKKTTTSKTRARTA